MRIFYIRDKAGPWLVEKFEALCAIRERSGDEELMYEAVKGELQSRLAAVQVGPDVSAQLEALESGEIA